MTRAGASVPCPSAVVIMGVTGAGKTTVGRALARALGRPFHDADDFHPPANVAKMAAGVALTDADRAPWLAALAAMIARELAAARPLVLACSALRHAYRDALARPETAAELRFVHLALSPETAHARLAARAGHFMPASLVQSQFATLEIPSDAVTLDASRPVDELVAEARRALGC